MQRATPACSQTHHESHRPPPSRPQVPRPRFYCDVLGLEIAFPHDGMLFLRTPAGDDLLNFVETRKTFDPKAGGFDHFGFHAPGTRWTKTLAALGKAGRPERRPTPRTPWPLRDGLRC